MKTYLTNKHLLPTLALACLAPWAAQTAEASATFTSFATVTYTITSLSNLTNAGNYADLAIVGSLDLDPGQAISTISGAGSVSSSAIDALTTTLTPAIGSVFTKTFQLDGSASSGGEVAANYLAWFGLAFENTSLTDSYNIGLRLSYSLSASAGADNLSDNAFTDITLDYFDESATLSGTEYVNASSELDSAGPLSNGLVFSFALLPGSTEGLYVDAGITASALASPVPIPSALWLFASGLLVPGFKKLKDFTWVSA